MPGKSKKGGGLEVGSAYKMKNPILRGVKHGSSMQVNYGSPLNTHTTGVPHKTDEERLKEIEQMQDWWSKKEERAKATKTRDDKIKQEKSSKDKPFWEKKTIW
tara:strand:+ start:469 stop:777 length:309 start_codon:yes stop_codon:yes gene_type:complete